MSLTLALCTIVGTLIALATFILFARSQAQSAEALRRQEIADEVKAAVDPVRAERDYWRGKADQLAAELRRRS